MSDRQVIARISNDTNHKYVPLIYGGYVNTWIWLLRTIEKNTQWPCITTTQIMALTINHFQES